MTDELSPLHLKGVVQDPETKKLVDAQEFADSTTPRLERPAGKDANALNLGEVEKQVQTWLIETERAELTEDNSSLNFIIDKQLEADALNLYQDISTRTGKKDFVLELSESGFNAKTKQYNEHDIVVELASLISGETNGGDIIETADDDRVIGIPYTIANIGADKYYVIDGRIYSGWAMWYGLQAIRSPENYDKNVDIAYNVAFVWAGFKLKATLSLGASFEIVHGSDEDETPEEGFAKEIFARRLNIGRNKLDKTSMHLDMYGNAYWHIRRGKNGVPDKITILQPERIKIFLDPKTTKVLYYIYLPPILAGMVLTPYPNIRNNPNLLHGPALTYPTPIVIDTHDIIHFKESDYTEYPFGISPIKSILDPAQARMDINLLSPMIFKKYAKPMIHWTMDPMVPFQLTKGQIESYIDGFKSSLENMEPMSDPITSTRWRANLIGAAQGKAELLTILQDLDNQIFSSLGVPESYFKPQGMSDRMVAEQDKTLLSAMAQRQEMVGEKIDQSLLRPIIDKYDEVFNMNAEEAGLELLPERQWNQYPNIQWRETFKQDQITTIQNTLALLQSGIIDKSRAARRVGEMPPNTSAALERQDQLNQISEMTQIAQAELSMKQTAIESLQADMILANGGIDPTLVGPDGEAPGGAPAPESGPKKAKASDGKTGAQKQVEDTQEDMRYKVTFLNANGKKQTEVMKGTTLNDRRSSGLSIQNIAPYQAPITNASQDNAAKAIGLKGK